MNESDPLGNTEHEGVVRPWLANLIFKAIIPLTVVFVLLTLFFGWQMMQLRPDGSFEKMIPVSHPFIVN